ncbi:3-hydroxyisobutyrate dehydrogenase-like beta-hydroxyacid dehydrogenase [Paenibacillus eucommiae]|uniref:3-hydroxyisobutyrate dehydrogenase-like beta-hydroxyacid dehydrogenase n=2 Tax=Paenibacillus eucommiae TaxID=1355755 RepID=A0ABS4INJ0_9BACL|nr:3-hydroxyisobutyrate dehydrogenase-like beta-hydroxyacid dehydrogenase [Paenibacillus eucommiae]
MKRIGFIGLGRMGSGICHQLISKGYSTAVFDINATNLQAFAQIATIAADKKELLESSDVIFLSLPGSVQVEETVHEFISYGISGKTIIDLSTSYPLSSKELYHKVTAAGGFFADASLTGTPTHAEQGALIVTVGGDMETYEDCLPIISTFASRGVHYIGGPGAGNIAKLANNYLSIMYVALYAEIFPLAEKLGFDTQKLFEIIGQSGVSCPMYQSNGAKIVNKTYDPSFSLDFALKDITYVKRLFDEQQMPSFVLDGGLNLLRLGHLKGYGSNDLSEMARVTRELMEHE